MEAAQNQIVADCNSSKIYTKIYKEYVNLWFFSYIGVWMNWPQLSELLHFFNAKYVGQKLLTQHYSELCYRNHASFLWCSKLITASMEYHSWFLVYWFIQRIVLKHVSSHSQDIAAYSYGTFVTSILKPSSSTYTLIHPELYSIIQRVA